MTANTYAVLNQTLIPQGLIVSAKDKYVCNQEDVTTLAKNYRDERGMSAL